MEIQELVLLYHRFEDIEYIVANIPRYFNEKMAFHLEEQDTVLKLVI